MQQGEDSRVTRPFGVITFDCYGTLIDWEAGIIEAFREAAAADGARADKAVSASYRSRRRLVSGAASSGAPRCEGRPLIGLGGSFEVANGEEGGLTVRVSLPLRRLGGAAQWA